MPHSAEAMWKIQVLLCTKEVKLFFFFFFFASYDSAAFIGAVNRALPQMLNPDFPN